MVDGQGFVSDSILFFAPGEGTTGAMPDYNSLSDTLWSESGASAVYIADGVTGIGSHAFDGIATLKKLELENPSTLTDVGEYAFNGCDKLTGPINLSGVTDLGQYAFNGCERLGKVTLSDDLTNIPKNAFNTCGLTSVNIPAKVETIGDGAFANNSLSGDLVLPDTLTTIGDNAFYRYLSGSSTGGYTSITIPSSVTSIGVNAFSGHKSLETVTLQHTDAGILKIEDGAFGKDTYTAHNYVTDVTVNDGTSEITYNNVSMGTQFLTQNEAVADLLENKVNCYLGDLKPLRYKSTTPATCEMDGFHLYTMTLEGVSTNGQEVTLDTKITIPAVGHHYVKKPDLPATCTNPQRTLEECDNVEKGLVETCEHPQNIATEPGGDAATGHDYQVSGVTNPAIAAGNPGDTVVTYTCRNYSEDEEKNKHDGPSPTYAWQIAPTTLTASTSHRLSDLSLPAVTGVGENTVWARLVWADGVDTNTLLTAGTHTYKVKLDITGTESAFPDYADESFCITVQVDKEKLDFSDVAFQNAIRYAGLNNPEFQVVGMPEGTDITEIEYCKDGEDTWTTAKPAEANADNDTADYQVRITFTYADDKYLLDTDTPALQPGDAYKLAKVSDGTGTITGDYVVRGLTAEDLTVTAKNGLVYNKTVQDTVTVDGIPERATVTVTWMEGDDEKTKTIASADQTSYDVAGITNAGEYEITVKVEHEAFTNGSVEKNVTGKIAKQPVATPQANTLQPYKPELKQTGVPDSTDARIYTVSNNKQTNAGTYNAVAELVDPSNYRWSTGDTDGDGTVEISYTIPKRQLQKPTLVDTQYAFTNSPIMPLNHNNNDLAAKFGGDGTLTAYWKDYSETYVAYTATNAQMTDVGAYTMTIVLNNSADVKNYMWAGGGDENLTLTWEITPKQIQAPTVTAGDAVYTGKAYDAANIRLTAHSENSEDILILGTNHIYYASSTASTPLSGVPVNAGTYYVEVDFDCEEGLKESNYQIIGNSRKPFTISKAEAELSFAGPTQSAEYTAGGTSLQSATVDGLVSADESKTPSEIYSIAYTYRYSADPNPNWDTIGPVAIGDPGTHTFTEVGYYQITATWGAGTVSDNYTADDATYTLTITQAGNQSITLTPDEESRWTAADETNPATYTITFGDAATFNVTGTAALDDAPITYAVTDGNDVIALNRANTPGTMKILKAGEATVTVSAAATGNVDAASVTYKVKVNQAVPTVTVVMPEGGGEDNTYGYTGNMLTFSATVTGPDGVTQPVTVGKLSYQYYADNDGKPGETPIEQPTAVGSYWVSATYSGDNNYTTATSEKVKVTISAAELTVQVNGIYGGDDGAVYDGADHDAAESLTVTGNGQDITSSANITYATVQDGTYSSTMPQFKDAGIHTVYYKVTADNYGEKTGSFTVKITPKALTVNGVPGSFEKVYDGNETVTLLDPTGISVETGITGETIMVSAAAGQYADENVGEGKDVTLTLTLSDVTTWGNYSYNGIPLTAGSLTITKEGAGKITKKPITVTGGIGATDRVYDGTTEIALTGTPTPSGFVSGDDVSFKEISTETGTVEDTIVGDNKPVTVTADTLNSLLTGDDAGNYTVSDDYTGARVNITARPVYLQFPGQTTEPWVREVAYTPAGLTSRPEEYQVSAKAKDTESGFVGDDRLADNDIAYSFVDAGDGTVKNPINLGTYTVTAELTTAAESRLSNYQIDAITGTIKIVQNSEDLSVTITRKNNLVYNGQGQDPIARISVEGGSETLTEEKGGYIIAYSVGDTDYDLNRAELTNAIKDAGTYTVYWKVTTTNYGDQTGSFTVDVERATLDLSRVVDATRTYNGTKDAADQVTGKELTGQQNSESITVSVTGAEYDRATVDASNITITYAITAGGDAKLDNYKVKVGSVEVSNLTGTTGTVTETVTAKITPAPVTVTINNQTAVYDGTTPDVAQEQDTNWKVTVGTVYQLTPGTPDDLGITLSIPGTAEDADTYDITGTASNENYTVTFAGEDGGTSGKFTITPREVAVTIGSASGIYGDTPNLSSVTLTGTNMVSGESTELFRDLISTTATDTSDVEEYDITAANGIHGNYNITFTPGTYTVEERPITITIADKSSDYGCDLAELGWDDAYTDDGSKSGIVNGDNLGIVLTTTATNSSPVGSYPITGTALGEKTNNYTITWAGSWNQEDANKGTAGTYTIEKATLTIAFTRSTFNVSMGNPVDNPLKCINSSNSNEEISDKPDDVTVRYTSSAPTVATVDENTGAVTILQPGDATITAKVTDGGPNFTNGATASYELRIATAGPGIQVQATPNNHLVYNGAMQQLLEDYTVSPSNASVIFTVTALKSGDQCEIGDDGKPAALDAGTYRVSWTASLTGYTDVTGWVDVTIDKANPSTGFRPATVQTTYEEDKIFDSTVATTLHVAYDYDGSITYLSDNTAVAKVNGNNLKNISINATGTAVIRAQFTETDNYKDQTVSFTLEVTDADTTIQYEADNYEVEYDGRPHGADITVTSPPHDTIWYSDDGGYSYTLTESPAITNVEEGPITIHFQIQAPGYTSVSGTQKVTVKPKEITPGMISGIAGSYTYTGQDIIVHTLQVADGRTLLDEGVDYDVEYEDNREVGPASVTITGKGNYTGSVTEYFEITAVESSYLSASLDRYFGFYDDEDTNSATVTVMHGDHGVTEGVSISVSGAGYDVSGQTITFLEPGVYEIEVEVTGSHSGDFTLYYTLLPRSGGDFEIAGLEDTIVTYDGEDHAFEPEVSYEGTPLTDADYKLTYSYTPFSGSGEGGVYDPASTEMTEAGLYVVTVTGVGSYGGTGTVVLLIAQRDLADSEVDADIPNATYDGSEQEPEVTLTYNGDDVGDLNATEYYYNIDAGEALAVSSAAAGNNNFSGTRVDTFRIDPKELNAYDFTAVADPDEYNYTGSVVTPEVIVTDTDTGDVLVAGRDYTVDSEAVEPGEHTADVIGRGNYTGTVPVDFTILAEIDPPPVAEFDLTVTPESWTYTPVPQADISVTFNDRPVEESGYTLTVERDGSVLLVNGTHAEAVAAILEPGEYAITATGTGVYAGYSDSDTVSVRKIRTAVTVTADPDSLVGGGTVTLTLSGQDLPGDAYLPGLLTVSIENGTQLDLDQLLWIQSGSQWTASFTAADASETYTFTLTYPGDSHYEAASDSTDVVTRPTGGDPGEGEEYIIRASAGTGGSISPSGRISVAEGDSQRFEIEADDGYEIADVRVDGESIGARSRYTFRDVDDDHTIRATFEWVGDSDEPDEKPDPKPDPDDNTDDTDEGDSGSSGMADPDDTGVANWLNTTEHVRYLNGYDTGMFMPGANMTRAEVAQMFYNLLLNKNVPITVSFTDVPATAWYADAVNVLASLGILTGYGNNQYAPDRPITRAEFTVIAMRFAQLNPGGVNIFSDVDADDWFYAQVVGSIQYGWITGYADGTFRPNAYITRAEVTAIVNRMLGRVADQAYVDSNTFYLKQFADVSRFYWGYYDIMEATNAHAYSMVGGKEAWLWLQ